MRDAPRIRAGHAFGTSIAVSIGKLDDEAPASTVLTCDPTKPDSWRQRSIPATVVALTSLPSAGARGSGLVAVTIDGDVHFLESGGVEKIPGAGSADDAPAGQGALAAARAVHGRLHACGTESRAYVRDPEGDWATICTAESGLGRCSFEGIAANSAGSVAACGRFDVKYAKTRPELEAELERLEREGPMAAYIELMNQLDEVEEYARGALCIFDGGHWTAADLKSERHLNDVAFLDSGAVVAVGEDGALVLAHGATDVSDRSSPDLRETLRQVRCTSRAVVVLGDSHVFVYDQALSRVRTLDLPPELGRPVAFDVIDDTLWCFGMTGIARERGGAWHVVDIPQRLWRRRRGR